MPCPSRTGGLGVLRRRSWRLFTHSSSERDTQTTLSPSYRASSPVFGVAAPSNGAPCTAKRTEVDSPLSGSLLLLIAGTLCLFRSSISRGSIQYPSIHP